MIRKVLKQAVNLPRLIFILLVMWAGFSIIMLAVRFYADIRPAFSASDLWRGEHLIISKDISPIATTGQLLKRKEKPSFSQKEMREIESQTFISDLTPFTASSFKARAYTANKELGGFYTELFFESVPDRFIDLEDEDWGWNSTRDFIPVILPKTYLNLYNFGFATAQNLPQISEEAAGLIPFKVSIEGNGTQAQFEARIVGFSDRLNTILVPLEFLTYTNAEFGETNPPVSRLILITPDPSDTELLAYIKASGYDYNKEQLNNGKARLLLNTATVIVLITGLFISLLALWMFILSSHLLLQKNKQNIHYLIMLGYSHRQILRPFLQLNALTSVLVFGLSLIPYFMLQELWRSNLKAVLSESALNDIWVFIGGMLLLLILGVINILSTSKSIKKL